MPAIVLAPRADAEMADVLARTFDRFGERKYLEYRALIRIALETLAADPTTGKRRSDIHPDAWAYHIARRGMRARHLFLYRIRDDVEIARFLYDAMDLVRQTPDEWDDEP